MILSGDIGGTNTRLALWQWDKDAPLLLRRQQYKSRDVQSLAEWIRSFLTGIPRENIEGAALCLAGAGEKTGCRLTNTNAVFQYDALRRDLHFLPFIHFCNDMEALAASLPLLKAEDLLMIQRGSTADCETKAVIAPGTGLGEGFLFRGHTAIATEGGHSDFAPQTEEQWALHRFLSHTYSHVSYERVLSGPGLRNIHRFFASMAGKETGSPDGARISHLALTEKDPLALRSLTLFRSILGAEAGNMALRTMALGGVYIGGGIAPQIADFLNDDSLRAAFTDKGRFRSLLETVPIAIVTNTDGPLLGGCALVHQALSNR